MPDTQKQTSIAPRQELLIVTINYSHVNSLCLFDLKCLKRHTDVSETTDVNFDVLIAILKGMRPVFT